MHTHPMKLVTIVAEAEVEHRLTDELLALGAAGFTVVDGRGAGTRHRRASDLPGANVRVETVVPPDVAERILDRLSTHWFADHSLMAYVADVAVVRTGKFARARAALTPAGAPDAER